MANNPQGTESEGKQLQTSGDQGTLKYLGGTDGLLDNQLHVGVSVHVVSAGGAKSDLVISDVAGGISDQAPVFISKPVKLNLANLKTFLENMKIPVPEPVNRFLEGTSLSCDAFYYTGAKPEDPLFIMFALNFDGNDVDPEDKDKGGLIQRLTGSKELGALFDVNGVSLRVLRCDEAHKKQIIDYCTALSK